MFGYVQPCVPELRVAEYEVYRALYCGLCRALGHGVTCTAPLTLSYDFVFFALIRLALSGEKIEFERRRCPAHPTKKRTEAKPNETLIFTARAASLLVYYNILDDVKDKKGIKKLAARLLFPEAKRMRKRALRSPLPEERIRALLSELDIIERENEPSCDKPAYISGELLGELISHGLDGANARIAREIGIHTGRFVYLIDACDDIYRDEKEGGYNPILRMYEGMGAEEIMTSCRDSITAAMKAELMGLASAVELIDCDDGGIMNIIKNIIYIGMPDMIDKTARSEATRAKKKDKGAIYDRSL